MTIVAVEPVDADWYTPEDERKSKKPTKFKLKALDQDKYRDVMAAATIDKETLRITGEGMGEAIRYGLVGWRNFVDRKGKGVKFSFHNFKKIPAFLQMELAREIIALSEISEEQEKN